MANTLFFTAIQFNPSTIFSPQSQVCGGYRIRGIARRARYGDKSVMMAKMRKGQNAVKLVLENEKETTKTKEKKEPLLLRIGIAFVTELLGVFSSLGSSPSAIAVEEVAPLSAAIENLNVVDILREDYERAYFLTGDFAASLYDVNCLFADPTIQFRDPILGVSNPVLEKLRGDSTFLISRNVVSMLQEGRDKYQRNLKLLVPFFEEPRLTLFDIQEESLKEEENVRSINAKWNLRTYLKLPWKPLIDVNGSTLYVINTNSKIISRKKALTVALGKIPENLEEKVNKYGGK